MTSLNPCSIGICSLRYIKNRENSTVHSLNPCSIGICSLSLRIEFAAPVAIPVLILVLLEYAL